MAEAGVPRSRQSLAVQPYARDDLKRSFADYELPFAAPARSQP